MYVSQVRSSTLILKYQYACTLQSCHHITFFPLSCSSACNFTVIINFMTIPICCYQVEAFLLDYSSKLALLLPLIHFQYQTKCSVLGHSWEDEYTKVYHFMSVSEKWFLQSRQWSRILYKYTTMRHTDC